MTRICCNWLAEVVILTLCTWKLVHTRGRNICTCGRPALPHLICQLHPNIHCDEHNSELYFELCTTFWTVYGPGA